MSRSTRFTSPFPPLQLTQQDVQQLHEIETLLITNTITDYEQFVNVTTSQLNERRWKCLKQRDQLRVFAERRGWKCNSSNSDSIVKATTHPDELELEEEEPDATLPVLLVVGSMDGTVDDVLYGAMCPTIDSMRIRSKYTNDTVEDAALLATLALPSADEPFRTMSIKWMQHSFPMSFLMLMKDRDLVFLESTGMHTTNTNKRYGFQVAHSVAFAQTPPLDGLVRCNVSLCALYVQKSAATVEIYAKIVIDSPRTVKAIAKGMLGLNEYAHCGRMKKLAYVVRMQECQVTVLGDQSNDVSTGNVVKCTTCQQSISPSVLESVRLRSGVVPLRQRSCRLCQRALCSTCRIKKEFYFATPDGKIEAQEFIFCSICTHDAMTTTSAWKIARQEVQISESNIDDDGMDFASTNRTVEL